MLTPSGVVAAALIAPPGAAVMAALDELDTAALSGHAQVEFLMAWERQAAWVAARAQPALVAVGGTVEAAATLAKSRQDSIDMPLRAAHAEISAALRISDSFACDRLSIARALDGPLKTVQAVLADGDISFGHVRAIWETTLHLSEEKQAWVAGRVLRRARRQSVSQLRRCLRRAVLAVDPQSAKERAEKAHQERKLDWWVLPDGMAELRLIASAGDVMAVYGAADALARSIAVNQPARDSEGWTPIAALRSDALVDLTLGIAATGAARGVDETHVTMDMATLFGLRQNPAELAGYGPLPASLARALAADTKWRRLIHDPLTGGLLDLGTSRYEPGAELTRYVETRDGVCAFPTCNRKASSCDIDHTRRYKPDGSGGTTDRNNLGAVCESHHRLKHEAGWSLRRDRATQKATWTSLTGHEYAVDHVDHRSFEMSDAPDLLDERFEPRDQFEPYDWCLPDPIPPVGTWPFDDLEYANSSAGVFV